MFVNWKIEKFNRLEAGMFGNWKIQLPQSWNVWKLEN